MHVEEMEDYQGHCNPAGPEGSLPQTNPFHTLSSSYASHPSSYIRDDRSSMNQYNELDRPDWSSGIREHVDFDQAPVTFTLENKFYSQLVGYGNYRLKNGGDEMNITANPVYEQIRIRNGAPDYMYQAVNYYDLNSSGHKLNGDLVRNGHQLGVINGKCLGRLENEPSFESPNVRPGTISKENGCSGCIDSVVCGGGSLVTEDSEINTRPDVSAVGADENELRGGRDGEREMRRNGDYIKSVWINCRLPLLILLFSILLVLFFIFSGALIYLKYAPNHSRSVHYGTSANPCDAIACSFGAICVMENGSRAVCRCPTDCPSQRDPVCGSDDLTYTSECLLRMFACQHKKYVRVRHAGECHTPDPCAKKKCHYGAKCIPAIDGLYAICECPKSCSDSSSSLHSRKEDLGPVCGSDGKVYRNRCELEKEACRLRRNITLKYFGKCDPCEDVVCSPPRVCQLDEERRPTCHCGEVCRTELDQVCASDGKTYANECMMRQEACHTRQNLRIIFHGKCSSGVNPCESRTCSGYETCAINRFGIAQCVCTMKCEPIVRPVCGSDGKTYDNYCELTFAGCHQARHIDMSYRGTCDAASACARHKCPLEATCVEKNGEITCECPTCPSDYDPVCGSDGVSYQNECRLRLEACLTNSDVRKMYRGLCNLIRDFNQNDGCDRMQCDFYSICDGASGTVKCVCPQNCQDGSGPAVCGTDGVTYQSECELQKSACEQQKFVVLASTGPCDFCSKVQCKFGAECENGSCVCPVECPLVNEPVCGSDLMSYDSECELEKAACQLSRPLTVLFYGRCTDGLSNLHTALGPSLVSSGVDARKPVGRNNSMKSDSNSLRTSLFSPTSSSSSSSSKDSDDYNGGCASIQCEFGAVCELTRGAFPRCTCQLDCSSDVPSASPVCGSDLKLYPSECEMRRESCQQQKELRPRPLELCEDDDDDQMATKMPPCLGTINGCCPDGITAALGPKFWGCPSTSYYSGSLCDCNKFGSVNDDCDFFTQKCHCRHGVGGSKCDRCSSGFWGFAHSHQVCKECGCSRFGSLHQDCEQMTGKCACKAGVRGHKCDSCDLGEYLGPDGCTSDPIRLGKSCDQMLCNYGAECVQDVDRAGCACKMKCADVKDNQIVCGSNGMTYASECLMKRQACRTQQLLYRIHSGPCPSKSELSETTTTSSVGRWTGRSHNNIGPGDDDGTGSGESFQDKRTHLFFGSSVLKSTRHLPREQATKQTGELDRYADTTPASGPSQERIYLGDVCERSADCMTAQSICHDGRCVCREGFLEDAERIECKSIHAHSVELCAHSISSCPPPAYCFDYGNGTSACVCPLGKLNPKQGCHDRGIRQLHPFFNGRSSMKIEKLAGYHKLSLEMEITPYTSNQHGILIFSSQHANGSGDFLSLVLVDGFVELRYDLGDGPAILRSASRLYSGTTYHIVAKRYNRDGLLRIDSEEDVKGTSPGTMKSLNLDQGFMGWVPLNSTKMWELVGTSEGFVGCIHNMRVGRRSIHFSQDDPLINSINQVGQCPLLSAFNPPSSITPINFFDEHPEEEEEGAEWAEGEEDFIVNQIPSSVSFTSISHDNQEVYYNLPGLGSKLNPCSIRYPCQNHGLCWEDLGSPRRYKCVCHPDFMGDHCETRSTMREESGVMLDFQGLSYLELQRMENAGKKVSIEIWFMTRAKNGIILYNGQEIGKGDFITLLLMNGHVQYIFELGSGMANITWRHQVSLNEWHWVVATRDGREGTLQVDGQAPIIGKSPPTLSELNLELPLYVGGVRDFNVIHRELEIFTPFDGVLQYLKVNGETHHREIKLSLHQRLVHPYGGAPCGSALSPNCLNGGSCFPRLGSFHCVCSPDFIGESCEKSIQTPRPVRFDGQHFIEWPPSPFKQREEIKNFLIEYDEYDDPSELQFDTPLGPSFVSWNENDGSGDDEFMREETLPQDSNSPSESERGHAHGRNRIEIVFRTTSQDSGVIIWTGMGLSKRPNRKPSERRSTEGYMGLFIADGHVELRLELDAAGNIQEPTTVIRSKVKVNDGRWHKVVVGRQWRLLLLQVGGAIPQRATVPADGDNVIISDGRYWIGGVEPSVLPVGIPTSLHHQGFKGCVDLVRIEKQRLPLFKIAYSSGLPFCDDD